MVSSVPIIGRNRGEGLDSSSTVAHSTTNRGRSASNKRNWRDGSTGPTPEPKVPPTPPTVPATVPSDVTSADTIPAMASSVSKDSTEQQNQQAPPRQQHNKGICYESYKITSAVGKASLLPILDTQYDHHHPPLLNITDTTSHKITLLSQTFYAAPSFPNLLPSSLPTPLSMISPPTLTVSPSPSSSTNSSITRHDSLSPQPSPSLIEGRDSYNYFYSPHNLTSHFFVFTCPPFAGSFHLAFAVTSPVGRVTVAYDSQRGGEGKGRIGMRGGGVRGGTSGEAEDDKGLRGGWGDMAESDVCYAAIDCLPLTQHPGDLHPNTLSPSPQQQPPLPQHPTTPSPPPLEVPVLTCKQSRKAGRVGGEAVWFDMSADLWEADVSTQDSESVHGGTGSVDITNRWPSNYRNGYEITVREDGSELELTNRIAVRCIQSGPREIRFRLSLLDRDSGQNRSVLQTLICPVYVDCA
eukprot:GHVQ01010656.1.p1 GENE.GHVQ01010656.1~~GHVQ01010656.1.p1  ORF type:complete len:466 (-),score=79.42 GHVQ01010656.1:1668-3065(-)